MLLKKKEQFLPIKSGIIKLHIQYNYTTLSCGLQVFAADFIGEYHAQFLRGDKLPLLKNDLCWFVNDVLHMF